MIVLGIIFLFLHKNICCGYSWEVPPCFYAEVGELKKCISDERQILHCNNSSVMVM